MPSRQSKKAPRHSVSSGNRKGPPSSGPAANRPQRHRAAAGHTTRINAFVTSMGRRNQAKRDAR